MLYVFTQRKAHLQFGVRFKQHLSKTGKAHKVKASMVSVNIPVLQLVNVHYAIQVLIQYFDITL